MHLHESSQKTAETWPGTEFPVFVCEKRADQRNGIMQTKRKRGEKICIRYWK
jgi:hypothetical protein